MINIENVNHLGRSDDVNDTVFANNCVTVARQFAWVDVAEGDVFVEDFHCVLARDFFPVHAGVTRCAASGTCDSNGDFVGGGSESVTFELERE